MTRPRDGISHACGGFWVSALSSHHDLPSLPSSPSTFLLDYALSQYPISDIFWVLDGISSESAGARAYQSIPTNGVKFPLNTGDGTSDLNVSPSILAVF